MLLCHAVCVSKELSGLAGWFWLKSFSRGCSPYEPRVAGIQWFDWVFGGSISKVVHPMHSGCRLQGLPTGLLECPPNMYLAFLKLSNPAERAKWKPHTITSATFCLAHESVLFRVEGV